MATGTPPGHTLPGVHTGLGPFKKRQIAPLPPKPPLATTRPGESNVEAPNSSLLPGTPTRSSRDPPSNPPFLERRESVAVEPTPLVRPDAEIVSRGENEGVITHEVQGGRKDITVAGKGRVLGKRPRAASTESNSSQDHWLHSSKAAANEAHVRAGGLIARAKCSTCVKFNSEGYCIIRYDAGEEKISCGRCIERKNIKCDVKFHPTEEYQIFMQPPGFDTGVAEKSLTHSEEEVLAAAQVLLKHTREVMVIAEVRIEQGMKLMRDGETMTARGLEILEEGQKMNAVADFNLGALHNLRIIQSLKGA